MRRPDPISAAGLDLDRREALKLLASGLALSLAACAKPQEEILPYVDMPERVVPGQPLRFATTLELAGYGRGVLATSIEGRPIKIEGNPRHPASLGATDVFAEAALLSLYDPDRSKAARHGDDIVSWDAVAGAFHTQLERERARQGSGLRILTARVTSPTLLRQLGDMLKQFPQARWYRYAPVSDDSIRAGSVQAYGRALTALPRMSQAAIVLALHADPLGPGPEQIRNARRIRGRAQAAFRIVPPALRGRTGLVIDRRQCGPSPRLAAAANAECRAGDRRRTGRLGRTR